MRETEPTKIITGEKIEWRISLADYPASLWTLTYYFRGPGVGVDVVAAADGDDHVCTLPSGTSDNFSVAGKYKYHGRVQKILDATDKHVVRTGYAQVELAFDPTNTAAVELRSLAKQIVDSIDAAVLAFANSDVQEYEISTPVGSRRVKRSDKQWFMALRKEYVAIVAQEAARERVANGGPLMQRVGVRFKDV